MFSSNLILGRGLWASVYPASSAHFTWKDNFMHNTDKFDYWLELGKDKNPVSEDLNMSMIPWVQVAMSGRPKRRI